MVSSFYRNILNDDWQIEKVGVSLESIKHLTIYKHFTDFYVRYILLYKTALSVHQSYTT